MSRYGYFDTFCRDSGNRWSTLPGKHCSCLANHMSVSRTSFADVSQCAMYVAPTSSQHNHRASLLTNDRATAFRPGTHTERNWLAQWLRIARYHAFERQGAGELGSVMRASHRAGIDRSRVHFTLRHSNTHSIVPALEIRTKKGSCRQKVCTRSPTVFLTTI